MIEIVPESHHRFELLAECDDIMKIDAIRDVVADSRSRNLAVPPVPHCVRILERNDFTKAGTPDIVFVVTVVLGIVEELIGPAEVVVVIQVSGIELSAQFQDIGVVVTVGVEAKRRA